MKKKTLIFSIIFIVFTIFSVGVVAYFVSESTFRGTISTGSLKLKVHQESIDGVNVAGDGFVVMPGDVVSRIVTVENVGEQSLYLRVKLITSIEGEELSTQNVLGMNINTEEWTYKDGYYYYYKALEPGEVSSTLFTEITINGELVDNKYLGKNILLDVVAQATQSKNNADSVLDAEGWPE